MGVKYDVSVWVPPSFKPESGKKLPLLVVTDGNNAFTVALDAARSLINQGAIGEMIIASIGTPPEDGEKAFVSRRVYEFSPPNWDMKDPFGGTSDVQDDGLLPTTARAGAEVPHGDQRELTPCSLSTPHNSGCSVCRPAASWAVSNPSALHEACSTRRPWRMAAIHRLEADYAATHKDLGRRSRRPDAEINDPTLRT
jgi:hypothetical protein